MNTTRHYCPVRAGDVRVAWTPAPLHEGEPSLPDAQLVCLSFGRHCAGQRCPITGFQSAVMGVLLARSGYEPEETWRLIQNSCDGCGRTTDMAMLDNVYAYCNECGTTNRWLEVYS
jgi:hypothetical protein